MSTSDAIQEYPDALTTISAPGQFPTAYCICQVTCQHMMPVLAAIWHQRFRGTVPLPDDYGKWGWSYETQSYSPRRAMDELEQAAKGKQPVIPGTPTQEGTP